MPKIKKRPKKAYKPKITTINPTENALMRAQNIERKRYPLRMEWDLFNADRIIEMYVALHNIPDNKALPLKTLYMIYKGDLMIAIRKSLISEYQGFRIKIDSIAKHTDFPDDRSQDVYSSYYMDFSQKPISYNVFMQGKEKGKYTFKRDGVFDVQWEGITQEWNRYLAGEGTDKHVVYQATAYLECDAVFSSPLSEREFHATKKRLNLELRQQLGGVAA